MLLALTGFVMIGLLMYFLLKGKAIPVTLFVVLPIIGALINGFGIADITDYIKSGVSTTWGMAALFVFVITYFGIMTDVGMFDKLVKKLIKIANGRVLGILLVVVLVSILGHLDGNSPTTYLIVIPAMAPLCKKLNIRISTIMMVCTATITVMNLVPWGGVLNRQSITLAMDSNELWHMYLPLQVCGLVCCVGLAVIMARVEVKRGAGKIDVSATQEEEAEVVDEAAAKLLRPKLLWYNVLLTETSISCSSSPPSFPTTLSSCWAACSPLSSTSLTPKSRKPVSPHTLPKPSPWSPPFWPPASWSAS